MTRRIKKIGLSPEWFILLSQSMNNWPEFVTLPLWGGAIPADAKVEDVYWSNDARCWKVLVSHESFPEAPVGEELPIECYVTCYERVTIRKREDGSFVDDRGQPFNLPLTVDKNKILRGKDEVLKSLLVAIVKELARREGCLPKYTDSNGCWWCGKPCECLALPGVPVSVPYCIDCSGKAVAFAREMKRDADDLPPTIWD